jgi:hypothetical protein
VTVLLNPQLDADLANEILCVVRQELKAIETRLCNTRLERDEYLCTIGAANVLRRTLAEATKIYAKRTNV